MKTVIVLAMHGVPPNDFPKNELGELFGLHARLEYATATERASLETRYAPLDARVRAWPRTPENDPFYAGSYDLARHLCDTLGFDVIVGFNEFCAPSLEEAFNQAAANGADQVIVVTPMMTRGGEHSEVDIPNAIRRAQGQHPRITFRYAWPFETCAVAQFLAAHVNTLASKVYLAGNV